ncbi:MAG: hypothetical protein J3Q66DRAFT_426808 [Benniella sp.]|nr:MAG: hypothetical protein J3Q66DRAFT_426808 [Benniella sp.]
MPALNDEYLFPISIFVLNVILGIFRAILLAAVGACFVLYSKYGGPYANSIRWTRSAGFLQMIRTLRHIRKYVSRSARVALVVAFFATVAASFLDKGIAHFIKPALYTDQSNVRTSVFTTSQSSPQYMYRIFDAWSFKHAINTNITDAMKRMLNSSTAIPNAVSVNSMTSTRFTFSDGVFDVLKAKELFTGQSIDLFHSMQKTFEIKTFGSNTSVELWLEVRAMSSSIEALACSLDGIDSSIGFFKRQMLECVYVNINVMVVKQPFNSNISAKLGKDGFSKPPYSTYMTMEYVVGTTNGKTSPMPLERLKSDVAEVSHYMARLGYNFFAEFGEGKLHIEYEIRDVKLGFMIPLWILLLVGVLLIAGVLVWLAETWVGSPYNSSLYSVIVKQVPSERVKSTSRLVKVQFNPLTFDGIPVQLDGENIGASDPGDAEKTT